VSDGLRVGVLLSGGGRTLGNLLEYAERGELGGARIVAVVSSKPGIRGLAVAEEAGIPAYTVPRSDYPDSAAFSEAINAVLRPHDPELVVLAGFLSLYNPPEHLRERVMNIHPALLPSFGGHGCYGHRVHEAVLEYGCKVSGCTVHFADAEYDSGPIIVQRCVPVMEDDDADSLAARVFEQECAAYPEAVRLFAEGRLRREGRRVIVVPAEGL
jgi:formyltetrahydrofolate-dependent phosphoribosylglycinamide formyltransferase